MFAEIEIGAPPRTRGRTDAVKEGREGVGERLAVKSQERKMQPLPLPFFMAVRPSVRPAVYASRTKVSIGVLRLQTNLQDRALQEVCPAEGRVECQYNASCPRRTAQG